MPETNPYQSPETKAAAAQPEPRRPFDIGRFVGRYLQVLAGLSVLAMVIGAIFLDQLMIDVSFVFYYWAGRELVKHNPTARKWVIGFSGFIVLCCVAAGAWCAVFGTEGVRVGLGVRQIEDPPRLVALAAISVPLLLGGIPLGLLLTRQAKAEFQRPVGAPLRPVPLPPRR